MKLIIGSPSIRKASTLATIGMVIVGVPLGVYLYKISVMVLFQNKIIYPSFIPPFARSMFTDPKEYPNLPPFQRFTFIQSLDKTPLQTWIFLQQKTKDGKESLEKNIQGDFQGSYSRGFLSFTPLKTKQSNQNQNQNNELFSTSNGANSFPTIIYFQGNAGNISHRLEKFQMICKYAKCNLVTISYRGYGKSGGRASEKGIQKDALAIYDFILNQPEIIDQKNPSIFLYGQSLGGAVAIYLANYLEKRQKGSSIKGLIIENTFTSIEDMIKHIYPSWTPYPHLTFLVWNKWDSKSMIHEITCPMLFLSGEKDEIVSPQMMKTIYSQATTPIKKFVSFSGGFHDTTWSMPGYVDAFSQFVRTYK